MSRGMFNCEQHDTANDWRYAEKRQSRSFLLRPCCKSSTSQCSNDLDSAEWNIEENCVEAIESKSFHNQRAKSSNATARDSVTCQS